MIEKSESIGALAKALAQMQSQIAPVKKDRQGYGYRYADLAGVLDEVRAPLAAAGLTLTQWPIDAAPGTVSLHSILAHADSGEWIGATMSMPVETKKGLSSAQCVGMVLSYLRRYAICAILGVAQEDNDAAKDRDNDQPRGEPPSAREEERPPRHEPPPTADVSGSEKQRSLLWSLARKLWGEDAELQLRDACKRHDLPESTREMTRQQMSSLIMHLQKIVEANNV